MKLKQTIIKREVEIDFRQGINKIAKFVGVSRQTVYNWRTGKAFPSDRHLAKLADFAEQCDEQARGNK